MDQNVDQLREELKSLGYLSRGIERWFALDPFRSRTFWGELLSIAAKSALLIAPFLAAIAMFVMTLRNHLPLRDAAILGALYVVASFVLVLLIVIAVALLLRFRAEAAVENPRLLTVLSTIVVGLIGLAAGAWWYGFDSPPARLELLVGLALFALYFVVGTAVIAAATLSFSIYETQSIPRVRRARQGSVVAGAATLLIGLLAVPAFTQPHDAAVAAPQQVVVTPRHARVALLAIDGLTLELAKARPEVLKRFTAISPITAPPAGSPPERWATIGTGTRSQLHGVHSVEGARLAGGSSVMQASSRYDFVLRDLASALHLAVRQPLPPTARRRDYVWETLAKRGFAADSINWWATSTRNEGSLAVIGPDEIFVQASTPRKSAEHVGLAIDELAVQRTLARLSGAPDFVTVYLPALDIVLNRLDVDPTSRVTLSMRALDPIGVAVEKLTAAGYQVILIGLPGERQSGTSFLASSLQLQGTIRAVDLAPTLLDLYGFPASEEMSGHSLLPRTGQSRIASYGSRNSSAAEETTSREYYENLKSLGYIR